MKGDIVEALQCVKCAAHHDLLFHEPGPSSVVEDGLDGFEVELEPGGELEDKEVEEGWNVLISEEDEEEKESESDIEMDEP